MKIAVLLYALDLPIEHELRAYLRRSMMGRFGR